MPKAETPKTIFAINAIVAKIRVRTIMAVLKKRTIIESVAVNAFVAKFACRQIAAIHAIAAFYKMFAVVAIFIIRRKIAEVNVF